MKALTDEESDAMEMKFPVYVHGMLKMDSFSRRRSAPTTTSARSKSPCPSERRVEQTRLEVRYSPTLAGAMVDALPYLVDYPYGCTEQTLNRFLPTVITQQMLLRDEARPEGDPGEADQPQRPGNRRRRRARQGLEAVRPQPGLRRGRARRRSSRPASSGSPRCSSPTAAGAGSAAGANSRTPHTTAVVVHGLQIAKQNDVALVPGVLERGVEWLKRYQDEQLAALANVDDDGKPIDKNKPYKHCADNLDALVYMVLVDADVKNDEMRDFLYRDRTQARRLRHGDVRPRPAQAERSREAGDDHAEHRPVRRPGRREPDRLPQPAAKASGGTGTAARSRPTPTTSSCSPRPTRRARSPRGW